MSVSNVSMESASIFINLASFHILITCVYRPSGTNVELFNTNLNSLLHLVKQDKILHVVVEDFNFDLLKVSQQATVTTFYKLTTL